MNKLITAIMIAAALAGCVDPAITTPTAPAAQEVIEPFQGADDISGWMEIFDRTAEEFENLHKIGEQ